MRQGQGAVVVACPLLHVEGQMRWVRTWASPSLCAEEQMRGVRTRQGRGTVVTICHRCHLMCGGMDEVARASPLLSCVEEQMRGVRKR